MALVVLEFAVLLQKAVIFELPAGEPAGPSEQEIMTTFEDLVAGPD